MIARAAHGLCRWRIGGGELFRRARTAERGTRGDVAGGRRVAPDGSGNIRGRQLGRDRRPTRPPFVAARPICHSRFFSPCRFLDRLARPEPSRRAGLGGRVSVISGYRSSIDRCTDGYKVPLIMMHGPPPIKRQLDQKRARHGINLLQPCWIRDVHFVCATTGDCDVLHGMIVRHMDRG
jgi:hypothetical protein